MPDDIAKQNEDTDLSEDQIRDALERATRSELFERNERLRAFLTYVVEEVLEDRSALIRAKTIAQDVYLRDPKQESYSDNIVRVDARRLRRLLDEYYSTLGADDPVRISIETGSYVPSFAIQKPIADNNAAESSPTRRRRQHIAAAILGVSLLAVWALGAIWLYSDDEAEPAKALEQATQPERRALFERSGATLQAQNLCDQGRGILFPIAEPSQQQLATSLFRRAIELAPEFACGYAGAAHSLATLSIMAPEGEKRDELIGQANQMATRSLDLAPKDGWSVSAVGWVALAGGDLNRAKSFSRLSEELSPLDGSVLDFHGIVSILTGDYEEARRATDPTRPRHTFGYGHAHRNIYGVATFHAGDYRAAIASWNEAIDLGGPVSELTLVYLSASHEALGDHAVAARYAQELMQTWPEFPADVVLRRFYPDDDVSEHVIDLLTAAGWSPPTGDVRKRADAVSHKP